RGRMRRGGSKRFSPLPRALPSIVWVLDLAFEPWGAPILPAAQAAAQKNRHVVEAVLLGALLLGAGTRIRRLPSILAALPAAGLAMFAVISIAAYRLYLPDRPITFAFPVALALGIPLLIREAGRAHNEWRERILHVAVAAGFLVWAGDGLPRLGNIFDWSKHHTPAIDFLATVPPDALVAAHPETSSFV